MLATLGTKLLRFLGEKHPGFSGGSQVEKFYKNLMNFYKMSDLFPYESYDEAHQLFFNLESVGFVLEMPPLVGASEEMQKEVSGLFQHLLPEESSLQVILFADPHIGEALETWKNARVHSTMHTIAQKRMDYFNRFAFDSPQSPYTLRNFRCLLSFSQKNKGTNPILLENITQLRDQLITSLEMLHLPISIWTATDLINTLGSLFNMDPQCTKPITKRWDQREKLAAQIAAIDSHLLVHENELSLETTGIKIRSYQAVQSPLMWSLHAMGNLIGDDERDLAQIPCPFIIHYGVHIPKQSVPRAKVLSKTTYVERQAESPIGKYLPAIQKEAEELRFVREQIGKGERIVQSQFSIILFAEEQTLVKAEQILFNLYISQEWQLKPNRLFHLPMFLSALPMMWGENKVKALLHHKKLKTTLSTESANLLPLQGEWKGTVSAGMLLAGRCGQIFHWYPFDNQAGNYNVCVVGRSGSGKSVFMQELMTTTLGLGGRVFVLDVGRSFEKTCFLLEGQFIEFKAKTPLCLNPFSSIPTDNLDATQDALAMLKSILILMAAPTKGVDDMEAALIEQAILAVWHRHQQDSNISAIADYLKAHRDKKAQDLGTMLFPYTEEGAYGRFFNGPSTVNLENALVVVELEELKERKDLQAVIVQMIIINITNRMFLGDRKTPFTIVFDEAWDLLRGAQSGVFIETLARRLRKYYGSLVVGTQSVNDLFGSVAAQAAFDNSDWMCLLSQKSESIEQLKKLGRISLTPLMESQLKSVKTKQGHYAELMIYGPHGYAIGRLLLDPYSQLLYSTKAHDYAAVQTLREQGLTLNQALEQLLDQRKNNESL